MHQSSTRPAVRPLATLFVAALLAVLALLPAATASAQSPVQFGTWSPGEPYQGSVAGVDALQGSTGRRVDIVNWYQNWGGGDWISSVQPRVLGAVTGSGRTPLLTWEPWDPARGASQPEYRLQAIAGGAFDSYIASFAAGLRNAGGTVYLRPMHEMNGNWYPWAGTVNGNTGAQYIAAWRRMVDIFRSSGAGNVKFVWSPNNVDIPASNRMEDFYPGSDYVDVLAVDGYNWGSTRPDNGGWQSFMQVFGAAYDRLKALGPQPIWIAEVGSAPEGGDKAEWIRDMFARAAGMDRLQAIVWFNESKERDWRADASGDIASAFRPGALATAPSAPDGAGSVLSGAKGLVGSLVLKVAGKVRAGRHASVRWTTKSAKAAGNRQKVRRWVVYLDGKRVRSLSSGRAPVLRKRLSRRARAGKHTWRVEGRAANGAKLLSGSRTFRVRR